MKCHRCGKDNSTGSLFCTSCGTPLVAEPVSSTGSLSQPETWQQDPGQPETGSLPYRDLGGLIGETFSVYRRNFLPFFLIALVPQAPLLIAVGTPDAVAFLLNLLGGALFVMAFGATVHAVIQQQLRRSISVGESYRRAWEEAVLLIIAGIIVGTILMALIMPLILYALALVALAIPIFFMVGIPLYIYLIVAWYFFEPPIILEGKGTLAALGRSRELVTGTWWRVFGIGVVFVLISIGLAVVGAIPISILTLLIPAMENIFNTVIQALIFPVTAVGATLVYLDLRTRKEGYTLEEMASEMESYGRASPSP